MSFETVLLDFLVWRGDPLQIIIFCFFFFLLSVLLSKLCCPRRRSDNIRLGDTRRGHRWYDVDFLHQPTYCSNCEQATVSGRCCESCGLCICCDEKCIQIGNKEFACKVLALSRRPSMKHHWQRGNMPLCSQCFVCGEQCGAQPRLCDLRCVWCRRTAHENCLGSRTTIDCDLGPHRTLIIPPYSVSLKLVGWRSGKRDVINELCAPDDERNWSPLLVLANPRSGGNEGEMLMRAFRSLLNPVQVFDLSEIEPESVLDLCRLLSRHRCRVLVCGGDGTVGWVLSSLDKLNLPLPPDIAICPMGTGNDLARVLGWGSGYTGEDPEDILHDVQHAQLTPVDRWTVNIGRPGLLSLRRPLKTIKMNNYFGIGCDAVVVLNFHKTRESRPDLFKNRIFNKAWYLGYGCKDVLEARCKNLHKKIELEMDGVHVDLPELEGIIIVNINSWCGGCPIWTTEQLIGSTTERSRPSPSITTSSSTDSLAGLVADRKNAISTGSVTSASLVSEPPRLQEQASDDAGSVDSDDAHSDWSRQPLLSDPADNSDQPPVSRPASSQATVTNSQSYGSSSFNDGMMEVVGLYSALHIARLQISLADPLRLGQARSVKITVKSSSPLPCQVDGEPWEQGSSVISITHAGQARMLSRSTAPL